MNIDEQRVLGVHLATGDQWTKTREIIRNPQHCYGVILLRAIKENGMDAVVNKLLQGPSEWAYRALNELPNLDKHHREALIKKRPRSPSGPRTRCMRSVIWARTAKLCARLPVPWRTPWARYPRCT